VVAQGFAGDGNAVFDDLGRLAMREGVSLKGVRGVGQLHVIIFLQPGECASRQRTQPIQPRLFLFNIPDADAQPFAEADLGRLTKLVNLKKLRERLGQTQDAFAATYRIPLGTLRDWEERRKHPDGRLPMLNAPAAPPCAAHQCDARHPWSSCKC
jgi:hypothetical protein